VIYKSGSYDLPKTNCDIPMPEIKPFREEPYNPINSTLKPYCKGCRAIEPVLKTDHLYASGELLETHISLECENAERCEQLKRHLESDKEG